MDKNKPQPKAFRITEETSEKFKEIAQTLGTNQQQTMAKLIEVYEAEMGREAMPEMRENIDTFEGYMRTATSMYMQALESTQNMRALVRTEFESQLKSKDKIIEEFQQRLEKAETVSKNALDKENEYKNTRLELEKQEKQLKLELEEVRLVSKEKLKQKEADYENLNKSYVILQETEQELRTMISSFMKENEALKEENNKYQSEQHLHKKTVSELELENRILTNNLEKEQKKLEEKSEKHEVELKHFKENYEMRIQFELQKKENEMKDKQKEELDALRKELDKYKELYYLKQEEKEKV